MNLDVLNVDPEEEDDLLDSSEGGVWTGTDISSFGNEVMEHNNRDGRCGAFWRDETTKRVIGGAITIVVLMSVVMLAVGGSKLGKGPDPSLLPWIGVIVGLSLLIISAVVGVLVFRSDFIGPVDL